MLFGGERTALTLHVALTFAFLAFIVVHLVQVIRAGSPALLGMLLGEQRSRRGLAWVTASAVALGAGFVAMRDTSGENGVPSFLRWTVAREHGHHRSRPHPAREQRDGER
jgi:hypothetical protein